MLKNKNIAVLIVILNKYSAVAEMGGRLATIDIGRKLGAVPLLGVELGLGLGHNVAWAEAYLRTKWHLDPSSRLATTDMGRKVGCCYVPFLGGAGSPSNKISPGLRPTSLPSGILIHPAVWPKQTWADNWGTVPLWGGEAGSPSNTIWPEPRPTSMSSFVLIHRAV